ncbi:DUF2637 domain-containing protein [Actinoplanes sp. NPDC051470]|uniref:DUF2637 domain-containing protein n=1 Tax=Actinoplanes sp. NPDC051470 TaxID=3157224 RepID=UPI003412E771
MAVAAASSAIASFAGLRGLAEVAGWPARLAWLLPITIDAYAMTSARVWLAGTPAAGRARRFARANAIGAIATKHRRQRWLSPRRERPAHDFLADHRARRCSPGGRTRPDCPFARAPDRSDRGGRYRAGRSERDPVPSQVPDPPREAALGLRSLEGRTRGRHQVPDRSPRATHHTRRVARGAAHRRTEGDRAPATTCHRIHRSEGGPTPS